MWCLVQAKALESSNAPLKAAESVKSDQSALWEDGHGGHFLQENLVNHLKHQDKEEFYLCKILLQKKFQLLKSFNQKFNLFVIFVMLSQLLLMVLFVKLKKQILSRLSQIK